MTTMTEPRTAPSRREPSTTSLVLDIAIALDKLVPLAGRVAEIVDVTRPTLKFLSPDLRQALDQAARDERAARVDTGLSSQLGLRWLRGRETDARLGVGRLAGRPDVISADADIEFTLRDLIRRLTSGLERAGVTVCIIPRLDHDPTTEQLVRHLTALVHLTAEEGWSRLLKAVARDLERLVDQAQHVIHGAKTTTFGDCPHCGRPTLVVHFDNATIRCDVDRKTNELEPCKCGDSYCLCRYKPVEFRHEWHGPRGWNRLKRLRARRETPPPSDTDASTDSKEHQP